MRFLPNEHADIIAELALQGFDPKTVVFVKRRGRLHVEVPGRAHAFAFFREKSTKLDARGKWLERVEYFVGTGKKDPCDWGSVMTAFRTWLKG